MFKNVFIKKLLKGTIFRGISIVNRIIPKDDHVILLYSSNRGIWNNLKSVKEYLVSKGYTDKYNVICGIEHMKFAEADADKVTYYTKIKSYFTFLKAKHVFYTAGQIPIKPSSNQIVIHLDHGAANFKKCGALTNIGNGDEFFFTYILVPSPAYVDVVCKEYLCEKKNVKVCGEASTDIMFGDYQRYDLGDFNKVILWTPTFRQSDYYGYDDSSEELLPMFEEADYEELNSQLIKYKFKLIVKLHPGQDLQKYKRLKYSNLYIYSDQEFQNSGYDLYNLMPQVDYMIGDYSSVFLQFLLLDKPLAFAVPDFEEYKVRRGFVFDDAETYMPGEFLKTKEDLYDVFRKWSNGIDDYAAKRQKVKQMIHTYQDGNNAKRALEISGINI